MNGATSNTHYTSTGLLQHSFGMLMQERSYSSAAYKYGFNGQEKDDEVVGSGNMNTAEYWEYDTRLSRRWNMDPVIHEYESPFAVFHCNPIQYNDVNGAQPDEVNNRAERRSLRKYERKFKKLVKANAAGLAAGTTTYQALHDQMGRSYNSKKWMWINKSEENNMNGAYIHAGDLFRQRNPEYNDPPPPVNLTATAPFADATVSPPITGFVFSVPASGNASLNYSTTGNISATFNVTQGNNATPIPGDLSSTSLNSSTVTSSGGTATGTANFAVDVTKGGFLYVAISLTPGATGRITGAPTGTLTLLPVPVIPTLYRMNRQGGDLPIHNPKRKTANVVQYLNDRRRDIPHP